MDDFGGSNLTTFSGKTVTMGLSTPGRNIAFSALHQHLVSDVASSNWFSPVQCTWQIDSIRNSMSCHVTSDSDFDKEGYVIQIKWIKALC